ncbi:TPA: ZIP family zinc transporter [Candidatus Berkelbacteria bacterium]|uniref:Zinc/iron permease, zinc transporter, ZIP family n=1 Tax=Berkelbacteria bacterium GW2011_GWE1_39_12 TaxID=1618337 RepID=A0A0G4B2R6_9BACT|nr:MAG: zinc/iron permease, zinc transporter, ZIP family [Berkelbacteria bacterium GW2011_GWE1_39_12]HBO60437.1 ZIP family zinc transporter [Candidatus Berkelbacteria bacterium]
MTNVFLYGMLSVLPLIVGAILGSVFHVKEKIIGVISAFGAGAMIAALTFGLMEESFKLGGFDNSILGFVVGGLIFVIGDYFIIKAGGRGHKRYYNAEGSTGRGIVLGAILDGIPESIALGIGLFLNPAVGLLMLVGIFSSNLPEGISSAYDLKKQRKSIKEILITWIVVALVGLAFVILGYTIFSSFSPNVVATLESLAAGAILAMLASTMMPEAFKESGIDSSMATVLGFLLIFILSKVGV